jgi:hypothetical protein
MISTSLFAQRPIERGVENVEVEDIEWEAKQRIIESAGETRGAYKTSKEADKSSKAYKRNLRKVKNQEAAEKVFKTLSKAVKSISPKKAEEFQNKAQEAGLNHRAAVGATIHSGNAAVEKHRDAENRHLEAQIENKNARSAVRSIDVERSVWLDSQARDHKGQANQHAKKANKINETVMKLKQEYKKGRPGLPHPPSYKSLENLQTD